MNAVAEYTGTAYGYCYLSKLQQLQLQLSCTNFAVIFAIVFEQQL